MRAGPFFPFSCEVVAFDYLVLGDEHDVVLSQKGWFIDSLVAEPLREEMLFQCLLFWVCGTHFVLFCTLAFDQVLVIRGMQ